MTVVVLGASGIIGQHMRLCVPPLIHPIWTRTKADFLHTGLDLADSRATKEFLDVYRPDVVINLAGQNNVDAAEACPSKAWQLNALAVLRLAEWCKENGAHLVQVSSQAVFDGDRAPYRSFDISQSQANAYGRQKAFAESTVRLLGGPTGRWSILRPTFVLGVRPLPGIGRSNPIEAMLAGEQLQQVFDRFFSVSFAWDVARRIWEVAWGKPLMGAENIGHPGYALSRMDIATFCRALSGVPEKIEAVRHDTLGLAQRPFNTLYAGDIRSKQTDLNEGLERCWQEMKERNNMTIEQRAREIALFLGANKTTTFESAEAYALSLLGRGFGALHNDVTREFNEAAVNLERPDSLLSWYRTTEAYIWELSAYHCDKGFNYTGMCNGIAEKLGADYFTFDQLRPYRVLCLGDGIGDLTLSLRHAGFDAVYHDLAGSRTAAFAEFRFWMYGALGDTHNTLGWDPVFPAGHYDAIVSLDFLEHVTDVEAWVRAVHASLKPGGLFCAQNAFACGSGAQGSIPMHLAVNDRFEKDWDPLLASLGFTQQSSNWYQKAGVNGRAAAL